MGDSLQEQLRALGLAKTSTARTGCDAGARRARKARQQPRQESKSTQAQARLSGARKGESELSLEQAYRLREKHAKEQKERARERKRMEDRKRRQLNERIRTIVEPHRMNDPAAEMSRNFMYKGRIRKVNVTAGQLRALNEGSLGLVYLAGGYHILDPRYVEQVRRLSVDHVPDLMSAGDEDDQCPVPDDLHW